MRLAAAALLALFALCAQARGNTSHFVDKLSCDSGPYSLKLPKTYAELRKIAPLKGEKPGARAGSRRATRRATSI